MNTNPNNRCRQCGCQLELIQYKVGTELETYMQCNHCGDQYMVCARTAPADYITFQTFIKDKLAAAPDWIDPMAAELEKIIKEVEGHGGNNSA